ncbi:helix-turn-helix domain-containing protein [Streptomyces niveus]|uniref:helix-turn-helix domain-containing protein n=1 Tax=Streptomyces niveus TaxID=193462 RepID=UPI0033FC692C
MPRCCAKSWSLNSAWDKPPCAGWAQAGHTHASRRPSSYEEADGPSGALIPDELAKGIHPGPRPLLSNPKYRGLLDTLRMYLDHAGDARRAAFTLHVHRST